MIRKTIGSARMLVLGAGLAALLAAAMAQDGRLGRPGFPPGGGRRPTATSSGLEATTDPATEPAGMEKAPWTGAQPGTKVTYALGGGVEQVREFLRADANSIYLRTSTTVAGAKTGEGPVSRWFTADELAKYMTGFGKKGASETMKVGEKEVSCDVYTKEQSFGAAVVTTKTWLCKEVPGWIVRVDNNASGETKTIYRLETFTN